MRVKGIGVDLVEVSRFKPFNRKPRDLFLLNTFSKEELRYCFSFKEPAQRLAGTFAAKEASFKALGRRGIMVPSVVIRRNSHGQPEVFLKGRLQKSLHVSISHTRNLAIAIAVRQ